MTQTTERHEVLVVVFQDPRSRRWFPIGRLSFEDGLYHFQYTRGAVEVFEAGRYLPFGVMTDFEATYRSEKLFPLFQNRVMPRSRPEYMDYTRWLLGEPGELSPLQELALSGGARATDNIQLYPIPKRIDGQYRVSFFTHGLRHLPNTTQQGIEALRPGVILQLMHDMQNEHDPDALALRTDARMTFVGYCPGFLCPDFLKVMRNDAQAAVTLVQVNADAPLQFRYRCEFAARWPEGFEPFDTEAFILVSNEVVPV